MHITLQKQELIMFLEIDNWSTFFEKFTIIVSKCYYNSHKVEKEVKLVFAKECNKS